MYLEFSIVFDRVDKFWVVDDYIIAIQNNGDGEMIMSPDLERYIREESVDVVENIEDKEEEEVETNGDMTIDSILDKISLVGVENLTKAEKRFLNKK